MKRNVPLARRTPLRSYTSLKTKSPLRSTGIKKEKSSSPKKKPVSISKLHKDVWELCKQYLRATQPNECYTCPAKDLQGSNWHTGHGPLPKAVLGLEWKYSMEILRSQCLNCNKHKGGMGAVFLERWLRERGWTINDYTKWKIEATKTNYGSVESRIFLQEKIAHYKQKLAEIT